MTPEQTKSAIAVMQAFIDGKSIQVQCPESLRWVDLSEPNWNWECQYRLKPKEPREYWVNPNCVGFCISMERQEGYIKVREVLE